MKRLPLLISLTLCLLGVQVFAQSQTEIKASDAFNQFLYDYNTNTVHGFIESEDSATLAAEAYNQFLYDYNVNTVHGFGFNAGLLEANVEHKPHDATLVSLVIEDKTGCLSVQEPNAFRSCMAAYYDTEFINAYVYGKLH